MSAKTTSKKGRLERERRLTEDIAMAVFRESGMTLQDVQMPFLEKRVSRAVAFHRYSVRTYARIASSCPGLVVHLDGGMERMEGWLRHFASIVVAREIKRIVSIEPRFGGWNSDPYWVSLGGDRRDYESLPLAPTQKKLKEADDYVDYWGGRDGGRVVVVYGAGSYDYLTRSNDDLEHVGPQVGEAFRRLGLVLERNTPDYTPDNLL